ncbi:MAG: CHAD domain-containing protein, partial [Candidatus Phaeomarinobacter sp.]
MSSRRSAPRELELKLSVTPQTLARIRTGGALARLPGLNPKGRATTKRLRSVYWDTPGHDLAAAGLGLRIRDVGGTYIQTLKSEDEGHGLLSDRGEDEAVLAQAQKRPAPDLSLIADKLLRRRVRTAMRGSEIRPLFESVIERTQRIYDTSQGDRLAVVFDEGYVALAEAPDVREPVCEIEIERISGPSTALFLAACALADRYPMSLGTRSKAARGYALGADHACGALPVTASGAIEKAGRSTVLPGMTLPDVYAVTLSRGVNQIIGNLEAVTEHRFPQGIHQMRVAMRRFRVAFGAFHKVMPLAEGKPLIADIKAVFAVLGEARDMDVFCTETMPSLVEACAEAGPGAAPDMAPLVAAADDLRTAAWESVLTAISGPEFTQLLLRAGALAVAAGDMTLEDRGSNRGMSLPRFARTRLAARWRNAVISHHDLSGLGNEARHEVRKQLKTLRYEAEFFAPLWPREETKPFMRRLKTVQDEFGVINDAATAMQVAHLAAQEIGGDRAHEAAGFVGGWYAARSAAAFKQVLQMWP